MTPIKTPKSRDAADQCREMGLAVGDVIQAREHFGKWWADSRLTLIFLGAHVAVFSEQRRNDLQTAWVDGRESANWTLNCRQWHKLEATE